VICGVESETRPPIIPQKNKNSNKNCFFFTKKIIQQIIAEILHKCSGKSSFNVQDPLDPKIM